MDDVDRGLGLQVPDLPLAKPEPHIHHQRLPYDFWRGIEVAEQACRLLVTGHRPTLAPQQFCQPSVSDLEAPRVSSSACGDRPVRGQAAVLARRATSKLADLRNKVSARLAPKPRDVL